MALGQMLLKFHYTFGTSGWYPKKYTECTISKQSELCMGELGSCRDSLGGNAIYKKIIRLSNAGSSRKIVNRLFLILNKLDSIDREA